MKFVDYKKAGIFVDPAKVGAFYCRKCKHGHYVGSEIGMKHRKFLR